MVTTWLTRAGSMFRTACGSSTSRRVVLFLSPIEYAASACPFGRDRIPARKISLMTAEL
jgi:hypothetical protein